MRVAGVRRIIVHNRISVLDPSPATKVDRSVRGVVKWLAARTPLIRADRTYAVSDFVRRRLTLRARIPEHRVVTILNGIDLSRFQGEARNRTSALRVFAAARATKAKGVDVLIRAAALLREHHGLEDFSIDYAGDGPDLSHFRQMVREMNLDRHFRFLGELPSTVENLRSADVVVVPSVWGDACPSAVAEGLASGAALVTTRVGGVPELVGDEQNALVVPPNDPEALAAAIATLARDEQLRVRIARLGIQRARDALDEVRYHSAVVQHLLGDFGFAPPVRDT
jgi:glycosyltransferase involved in cell wall biosynthesis